MCKNGCNLVINLLLLYINTQPSKHKLNTIYKIGDSSLSWSIVLIIHVSENCSEWYTCKNLIEEYSLKGRHNL